MLHVVCVCVCVCVCVGGCVRVCVCVWCGYYKRNSCYSDLDSTF